MRDVRGAHSERFDLRENYQHRLSSGQCWAGPGAPLACRAAPVLSVAAFPISSPVTPTQDALVKNGVLAAPYHAHMEDSARIVRCRPLGGACPTAPHRPAWPTSLPFYKFHSSPRSRESHARLF